jgi:hypothetical protein
LSASSTEAPRSRRPVPNLFPYDERGVIYVCLDAAGRPVYVGQTVEWPKRRRFQMGTPWWEDVALVLFVRAPWREQRIAAEGALIEALRPRANTCHVPGRHAAAIIGGNRLSVSLGWNARVALKIGRKAARQADFAARRKRNLAAAAAGRGPLELGLR